MQRIIFEGGGSSFQMSIHPPTSWILMRKVIHPQLYLLGRARMTRDVIIYAVSALPLLLLCWDCFRGAALNANILPNRISSLMDSSQENSLLAPLLPLGLHGSQMFWFCSLSASWLDFIFIGLCHILKNQLLMPASLALTFLPLTHSLKPPVFAAGLVLLVLFYCMCSFLNFQPVSCQQQASCWLFKSCLSDLEETIHRALRCQKLALAADILFLKQ